MQSFLYNSQSRTLPAQIKERQKMAGRNDAEIVAIIDAEWKDDNRLTNKAIGELFSKVDNETDDARITRGKRLRRKKI